MNISLPFHFHRLFNSICNSLLEADKLLFSYLMTVKVMQQEERVLPAEVRFLAVGGTKITPSKPIPGGEDTWVTNKMWCNVEEVSELLSAFHGWDKEFPEHLEDWRKLSIDPKPYEKPCPGVIGSSFTNFHKLIVTQIIAEDKVIPGMVFLIMEEYGEYYT